MRILFAIDRGFDIATSAPDSSALPLTSQPRGDIRVLLRALRAGPALEKALVERRTEVITRRWFGHKQYGELARRVFERGRQR